LLLELRCLCVPGFSTISAIYDVILTCFVDSAAVCRERATSKSGRHLKAAIPCSSLLLSSAGMPSARNSRRIWRGIGIAIDRAVLIVHGPAAASICRYSANIILLDMA